MPASPPPPGPAEPTDRNGLSSPSEPDEPAEQSPPASGLPVPDRALAIGAHPDDVDFGCGATLAKWAEAGCTVSYLVCTDGARGTWDEDADIPNLVDRRQGEQRAAAQALGAKGDVVFLGWPDGDLAPGRLERWQVVYWIRRLRPDVVLGHDPWKRYRLHPDHRHAGFLTVDAVATARELHAFTEQQVPAHRPSALLLFEADEPDHVEVVDEGHVARKLEALECHRSQFRSTMFVDDTTSEGVESTEARAQLEAFRSRVRDRLAEHGQMANSPWGEAFKALREI